MRPSRDEYFMDMARLAARRSTCLRRTVGCILVDARGHVLATGYNGVPAGWAHCNDEKVRNFSHVGDTFHPNACPAANAPSGTNLSGCRALHAEWNALLQCSDVHAIETAYCTTEPCVTCTKLFLNTSCQRIVAAEPYHGEGPELWQRGNRVFQFI